MKSTASSFKDLSGQGHDGVVRGPGGKGKGLQFDGKTLVTIPGVDREELGQAQTLSAWVNPTTINRQSIFGKTPEATDWSKERSGLFFSDFGTAAFAYWDVKSPLANVSLCGKTKLYAKTWTHISTTYDGKEIQIYVNGKLDATKAWTNGVGWSNAPMRIGPIREFDPCFKGQLGEIRLYNRSLSAAEISQLYSAGRKIYPQTPGVAPSTVKTIVMESRRSVKVKDWESFPTTTLDELTDYKRTGGIPLDIYGGRTDMKAPATGFFYAKQVKGRWWLIDPLGGYFIHAGVVAVSAGKSARLKESFGPRFGTMEKWTTDTVAMLKNHGFNGTGAWSDVNAFRASPDKIVYTVMVDFLSDFAKERGLTQIADGHTGYIKDSLPVFIPEFEDYCQKYAVERLSKFKDDPWMLGAFSDNELLTPNLKKYLSLDQKDPHQAPNYEAAEKWLSKRLGKSSVSAEDVTWELDLEFQGYVFDYYFTIVSKAIKAVLPHHIYLGSRLNTERDKINPHTWRATGKHVDVIALNLYRTWTPNLEQIQKWNEWSGKPVIITEWYVKGDDVGFPNTSGAGWIVHTQEDRGRFYQQFVLNLIKSKGIVGWHWFKYMDNDPNDMGSDISNRDSNKGIMQLSYEPYTPVMDKMKAVNREIYPLADYFDKK